ncbi:MAG TPA: T9SS type A sorting domain-containing protein, partial [Bacteroidia bacterium]|nr:T9SS type A sorting domain-containing protein [Bacteroidia bacterium]
MKKITLLSVIVIAFCTAAHAQIQIQVAAPGLQDVCGPNIATLEVVSPQPGYTYNWNIEIQGSCGTGYINQVGSGTTFSVQSTGYYGCYGIPPGGGNPQSSNMIPVRVLPNNPMPLFHGNVNCVASAVLCVPTNFYTWGGDVIKWYKNNVLISGAVSSSYTATTSGYYKYSVASVNVLGLCSATTFSDSVLVTIAAATITPSGSTAFCTGGSVLLNANTGLSYQWKLNTVDISGATNSTFNATAAGSYTVVVSHSCGSVTSAATIVTVNPPPAALMSGTTSICNGSSTSITVTFSNAPGPYSFSYNPGGIVVNNAVNPAVIPVSPALSTTYTLFSVSNASCVGTVSSSAVVTVNPLPSATITAGGPTVFCSGGSVILNAPVAANRTYQWKKGANIISGATLSSYTATTGGNYRVIVTNTVTGCSKTTGSATTVTVNPLPSAVITPQGPTTFCAGGSVVLQANTAAGLTYKWKKGSNFISGATLSNYTATTGGNYRVQVTNNNGCSKTSAFVAVSVPCKAGESILLENDFEVKVFPNPSSGDFVFNIESKLEKVISIKVFNAAGSLILSEAIHNSQFTILNARLAPGIYSS